MASLDVNATEGRLDLVAAGDVELELVGNDPRRVPTGTAGANLYDKVTASIIEQLAAGAPPWIKPWARGSAASGHLPFNAASHREYSGINTLLLWAQAAAMGYRHPAWLTLNQVKELGGRLRKIPEMSDPDRPGYTGQQSTMIVYYGTSSKDEAKPDGTIASKRFRFLKTFLVFNVEQCEGLPPDLLQLEEPITLDAAVLKSKDWIDKLGVNIIHGGDRACYVIGADVVHMPRPAAFLTAARGDLDVAAAHHEAVTLHEVGHWTGAGSRMKRTFGRHFGDPDYAREELVAELFSAFACARLGLPAVMRHAGYIDSWIRVLRDDSRAIFAASAAAKKALEWCDQQVADVVDEPLPMAAE